jgi:thiol-disulfide isomerase/thioredoxin
MLIFLSLLINKSKFDQLNQKKCMKKLLCIASLIICCFSGNAQKKENVSFQAEIANRNGDSIKILNRSNGKEIKKIAVDKAGLFKDSFVVEEGMYMLYDGKEYTQMFLKNGYNLKLKLDAKQFDESIVYSGVGAAENNFLAQNAVSENKYDYDTLLALNESDFGKAVEKKKEADFLALDGKKLNANFVALQKKSTEGSLVGLVKYHKQGLENNKMNGMVSPGFDFENHKGGKTKLEDLKGKYVYIDVWATWCGPCRAEIPFLKKVEEKYHDKNIVFVSISADVDKDHEKWKKFVDEKQLGGVQLFADKNWESDFLKSYGIKSIPRFILIDPNGKVVKSDAARPSSPKLQEELDGLLN